MAKLPPTAPRRPIGWSRAERLGVSLLLVWHLTAILIGPLSLPPSILGSALGPWFAPYHRTLFIGHAYKFFAPDPGPSHLIEYVLEMPDGARREGVLPDRKVHWPRLLYHRHFMLTEFIGNGPPDPSWERQPEWELQAPSEWQRHRAESYARHLLAVSGARRVSLTLKQHALATPPQITIDRVSLTDPRSYRRKPLGSFQEDAP